MAGGLGAYFMQWYSMSKLYPINVGGRPLNVLPYRRLAPPQFHPMSPAERMRWIGQDQFARLAWLSFAIDLLPVLGMGQNIRQIS